MSCRKHDGSACHTWSCGAYSSPSLSLSSCSLFSPHLPEPGPPTLPCASAPQNTASSARAFNSNRSVRSTCPARAARTIIGRPESNSFAVSVKFQLFFRCSVNESVRYVGAGDGVVSVGEVDRDDGNRRACISRASRQLVVVPVPCTHRHQVGLSARRTSPRQSVIWPKLSSR